MVAHIAQYSPLLQNPVPRESPPVWLYIVSYQLEIIGLVSHYPTNYLISDKGYRSRSYTPIFIR